MGTYGKWVKRTDMVCLNDTCSSKNIQSRLWESSDGGHEDINYRCDDCGSDWWVDGIDS